MKKANLILIVFVLIFQGCEILKNFEIPIADSPSLSTSEIIAGLKEALNVGTENAVGFLAKENGFYGNSILKIPFPEEVKVVEKNTRIC